MDENREIEKTLHKIQYCSLADRSVNKRFATSNQWIL